MTGSYNTKIKPKIPPSVYNAYFICKRQAWLMDRNLSGWQDNYFLQIGKLISEESYKREKKEIYIAEYRAKLDMIKKGRRYILACEVKKSSKVLNNAKRQLKYYLYILNKKGIKVKGELKIPKEKKNIEINFNGKEKKKIKKNIKEIRLFLLNEKPPEPKKKKICSKCAHFEFCFA
ncbi:MAG: CRISPR-associated protein Cas4 [Candidatus Mcinerneyibacterium aminivorans]|uniref:CRISPR-associated exonuclease Cas4 n=1 Tax=Candidatus Mcinerneyibacterium aminivorans TaxID=2703815 RepID=A0A5D0MF71_9BACT|nr:MAG: CRISPR-associated protein Cas4 [Candidatus Mcinerneyibacterium aminivorans]